MNLRLTYSKLIPPAVIATVALVGVFSRTMMACKENSPIGWVTYSSYGDHVCLGINLPIIIYLFDYIRACSADMYTSHSVEIHVFDLTIVHYFNTD